MLMKCATRMCLLVLICSILAPVATASGAARNMMGNGDFESDGDNDGKPDYWSMHDGVTWEVENGNHFARMEPPRPGKIMVFYRGTKIDPGADAIEVSARVRTRNVKRGPENWHDARIVLHFIKEWGGDKLKPSPDAITFSRNTGDWITVTKRVMVPKGAKILEFMPSMFKCESGTFDIDDVKVVPADAAALAAKKAQEAARRAETVAQRAARVKPQVPAATADQLPPALHVEGNQIVTADGDTIWLQGVAIPSMEWTASGEHILESVRVAIDDWNANVIRLPVEDAYWNGKGKWQRDGGASYRQLIDDVVNLAGAQGVYTVIDLHRFRAPEPVHAAFWGEVAEKYKNHPAVLFELFNEPHDVSWKVWRDGGFVKDKKRDKTIIAENKEKLRGFESVGMQALIDAVRNTGADNIVIAGGLDWGYDLGGVLEGYALDDRDGHGIVYSSHVYPWKSDWRGKFMEVAKKHPIFIGECGAPKNRLSFIPESQHEDPSTWVPDFLGLVQEHKYHWTAWSFHPDAAPVLLKDWTYEPNAWWGAPAKAALNGKRFEVKKLR